KSYHSIEVPITLATAARRICLPRPASSADTDVARPASSGCSTMGFLPDRPPAGLDIPNCVPRKSAPKPDDVMSDPALRRGRPGPSAGCGPLAGPGPTRRSPGATALVLIRETVPDQRLRRPHHSVERATARVPPLGGPVERA